MKPHFTSEVPAVPDQDYTYVNPDRGEGDPFEAFLERTDPEMPDEISIMIRHFKAIQESKMPKDPNTFPEYMFEILRAQDFINWHAMYDEDGRLNMDVTSQRLGIPYSYNMRHSVIHGETLGMPDTDTDGQPFEFLIRRDGGSIRATYGHEVGHYFWNIVAEQARAGDDEEDFCDYFGRRMALPRRFLREYSSIDETAIIEMMNRFDVGLNDLIMQLMEYRMLPERVAIDTYIGKVKNPDYSEKVSRKIICRHCSTVGGDQNCPQTGNNTLLFDFTDRAWADILTSCTGERLFDPKILSTLTKYYKSKETQLVLFRPGAPYEYEPESDEAV